MVFFSDRVIDEKIFSLRWSQECRVARVYIYGSIYVHDIRELKKESRTDREVIALSIYGKGKRETAVKEIIFEEFLIEAKKKVITIIWVVYLLHKVDSCTKSDSWWWVMVLMTYYISTLCAKLINTRRLLIPIDSKYSIYVHHRVMIMNEWMDERMNDDVFVLFCQSSFVVVAR